MNKKLQTSQLPALNTLNHPAEDNNMKDIRLMIAEKMEDMLDELLVDVADELGLDEVDLDWDVRQALGANCQDKWGTMADNIAEATENHVQERAEAESNRMLEEWKTWCLPIIKEECEQDGHIDGPARREDWCNFLDAKSKNGELSQFLVDIIDADVEAV